MECIQIFNQINIPLITQVDSTIGFLFLTGTGSNVSRYPEYPNNKFSLLSINSAAIERGQL